MHNSYNNVRNLKTELELLAKVTPESLKRYRK
jgi:hypothetical protein